MSYLSVQEAYLNKIRKRGHTRLWFHGTTLSSAYNIRKNGIKLNKDPTKSSANLGVAFYITDKFKYAITFSEAKPYTYDHNSKRKPKRAIVAVKFKGHLKDIQLDTYKQGYRTVGTAQQIYANYVKSLIVKPAPINFVQYWAQTVANIKGFGQMLNPMAKTKIKLGIYDKDILRVIDIIPLDNRNWRRHLRKKRRANKKVRKNRVRF